MIVCLYWVNFSLFKNPGRKGRGVSADWFLVCTNLNYRQQHLHSLLFRIDTPVIPPEQFRGKSGEAGGRNAYWGNIHCPLLIAII